MATKAQGSAMKKTTAAEIVPQVPTIEITLELHPTAKAEGLQAITESQGLVITDRASHEATRRAAKGWKATRRNVEGWHRSKILDPLKKATDWGRDQMRDDLARFDVAIEQAEKIDLAYVHEQQRIEREAAETARREAEERERTRRAEEQAKAEAEAERLEAASDRLSARESKVIETLMRFSEPWTPNDWVRAAKLAGYQDATASAKRLIASAKMQGAIAGAKQAKAIRAEATAKASAPVVVDVPQAESQIGKVAGTSMRSYYSCGDVDLQALILAVAENIQHGDGTMIQAVQANTVYLNQQARSLKEMFERVWPMCRLGKSEGVAG